jgi:hypothetical protein
MKDLRTQMTVQDRDLRCHGNPLRLHLDRESVDVVRD